MMKDKKKEEKLCQITKLLSEIQTKPKDRNKN